MWTNVKPVRHGPSRAIGVTVAFYTSTNRAFICLPPELTGATRCDVFRDGTRIGILPHDNGAYGLFRNGRRMQLTVPALIRDMFPPMRSTEVPHIVEGDMIVIDMASVAQTALAAE